jgi:hypothetical protein
MFCGASCWRVAQIPVRGHPGRGTFAVPKNSKVMAWIFCCQAGCGRAARAPFGVGNPAHNAGRNSFLFTTYSQFVRFQGV